MGTTCKHVRIFTSFLNHMRKTGIKCNLFRAGKIIAGQNALIHPFRIGRFTNLIVLTRTEYELNPFGRFSLHQKRD